MPLLHRFHRAIARFLTASSLVHLTLIVGGFVALRVFLSLQQGIVTAGDNAPQAGVELGRFWVGELSANDLSQGYMGSFLRQRTSQLLYPLLISLHRPLGLNLSTHILLVNTVLGAVLVVGAYVVGLKLHGKGYAVLVALLMCSITGLYWIARWPLVDNVFYALIPLAALSIVHWEERRTRTSAILLVVAFAGLILTRPESIFVALLVGGVVFWQRARKSYSRRVVLGGLALGVAVVSLVSFTVVRTSPALEKTLLTRAHVAWGLAGSAHTLLNRGSVEFDALLARYTSGKYPGADNMHYRMSMDAIATIRENPAWYVLKIPLRGLAILFPWTYQPWSIRHIVYEAAYTVFVVPGLVLLIWRGRLALRVAMLVAIPLAIWLFLSAYLIDNDLKHRNGILVALNLIAPLGYVERGLRRSAAPESE